MAGLEGCIKKAKAIGLTSDDAKYVKAIRDTYLKKTPDKLSEANISAVRDVLREALEDRSWARDAVKEVQAEEKAKRKTLTLKGRKQETREVPKPTKRTNPKRTTKDFLDVLLGTSEHTLTGLEGVTGITRAELRDLNNVEMVMERIIMRQEPVPGQEDLHNALKTAYLDIREQYPQLSTAAAQVRKATTQARKAEGRETKGLAGKADAIRNIFVDAMPAWEKAVAAVENTDYTTQEELFDFLMKVTADPTLMPDFQAYFETLLGLPHTDFLNLSEAVTNFANRYQLDKVTPAEVTESLPEEGPLLEEPTVDATPEEWMAWYEQQDQLEEGVGEEKGEVPAYVEALTDSTNKRFNRRGVLRTVEQVVRIIDNKYTGVLDSPKIVAGRQRALKKLAPLLTSTIGDTIGQGNLSIGMVTRVMTRTLHQSDPLKDLFRIFSKMQLDANVFLESPIVNPGQNRDEEFFGMYYNFKWTPGPGNELRSGRPGIGITFSEFYEALYPDRYMGGTAGSATVFIEGLAHEMVHAASNDAIRLKEGFAEELEDLRMYTVQEIVRQHNITEEEALDSLYGLTDVHEFLSEALTNPTFQSFLNDIWVAPTPKGPRRGKLVSLWDRFIRLLANTLGIPVNKETVLDEVLHMAPSVFRTGPERAQMFSEGKFNRDVLLDAKFYNKKVGGMASSATALQAALEPQPVDRALGDTLTGSWDTLKNLGVKARKYLLGISMLNQIVDNTAHYFDDVMVALRDNDTANAHGNNALRALDMLLRLRDKASKRFERVGSDLNEVMEKVERKSPEQMAELGELANESTFNRVYIHVDWDHELNTHMREHPDPKTRREAEDQHKLLRGRFKKLNPEVRNIYDKLLKHYNFTRSKLTAEYIANMFQVNRADFEGILNLTDPTIRDLYKLATERDINGIKNYDLSKVDVQNKNAILEAVAEYASIMFKPGPYFPALRYGDYAVVATLEDTKTYDSKEEAEKAEVNYRLNVYPGSKTGVIKERSDKPGKYSFTLKHDVFYKFDTLEEAQAQAKQLKKEGMSVNQPTQMMERQSVQGLGISQLLDETFKNLPDNIGKDERQVLKNAFTQAYLSQLPEASAQKRLARRKNVRGASADLRRSMALYTEGAGWSYSRMKYNSDISASLRAMDQAAKSQRLEDDGNNGQGMIMSQVYNEMLKRINLNPGKVNTAVEAVSKYGFVNYLLSLSYSIVNSTQPYTLALPYLTGEYGSATEAGKALYNAYGQTFGRTIGNIKGTWGGAKVFTDGGVNLDSILNDTINRISTANQVDPEHITVLKQLAAEDILGATLSMEMSEVAKGRQSFETHSLKANMNRVVEFGRVLPHLIEVQNRLVTALASLDLETQRWTKQNPGASKDNQYVIHLTDVARQAVKKTQFDYSQTNRPRYFVMNDLVRVLSIYKIHPLGVYNLYFDYIRQIKDPTKKKDAIKALVMLTTTHASLAGAAGAIFMEPLKLVMAATAALLPGGDDDELKEYLRHPELMLREMTYAATGSEKFSEVATFGLPRLINWDMYNRIGLHRMLIQYSRGENAWDTFQRSTVDTVLGPVFGMHTQFQSAASHWAAGDGIADSMMYLAPKGIRDIIKGISSMGGVTDFSGNEIVGGEQYGWWDMTTQAVGFTPSVVSETQFGRKIYRERTQALSRRRSRLIRKYKDMAPKERVKFFKDTIRPYNKSLRPDVRMQYRLTMDQLRSAVRGRREHERRTYKGIGMREKERRMQDNYDFLNLEK